MTDCKGWLDALTIHQRKDQEDNFGIACMLQVNLL
jgi:hypothetical protein